MFLKECKNINGRAQIPADDSHLLSLPDSPLLSVVRGRIWLDWRRRLTLTVFSVWYPRYPELLADPCPVFFFVVVDLKSLLTCSRVHSTDVLSFTVVLPALGELCLTLPT